jgi:uncharacterized protein
MRGPTMSSHDLPGVNIEEASGPRVIEGVDVTTAGFVGPCERGAFEPQAVTSVDEFERYFGTTPSSFLAAAVRGFFENGGRRCYIAHIAGPDGAAPSADDFIGAVGEHTTGLAALRDVTEISLLGIPDEVNVAFLPDAADRARLRAAMVAQCEELRDRFAVLQVEGTATDVNAIESPLVSTFAAMYYPWLEVIDPVSGVRGLVPPGGHAMGVIVRSTLERGVQKAPANIEVRGVVGIGLPGVASPPGLVIGDQVSDILKAKGINVIRDLRPSQQGIRIWGARTLAVDSEFRYISVRRLVLFIEQSLVTGLQWVVFEANKESTWTRVRQDASDFVTMLWKQGALVGSRSTDAFFVRCDRTVMTQHDIDDGRLACEIGIALVRPAEFLIIRIGLRTADAQDNP